MVKFKINWSIEARLDLIDILDFYIKRNGNTTYSIKLNSKINKSIKFLSKNPFLGTQTDYDSVRALITGDYQIVYEIFNQLVARIPVATMASPPAKVLYGGQVLTSCHNHPVVDKTSLGKVNVLLSNPAESTCLSFLYSLGFAVMWLLTRINMPHIPFLFVSSDFCSAPPLKLQRHAVSLRYSRQS